MNEEKTKTIGQEILDELRILQEVYLPGVKHEGTKLKNYGWGDPGYLTEKLDKSQRSLTRLYKLTNLVNTIQKGETNEENKD